MPRWRRQVEGRLALFAERSLRVPRRIAQVNASRRLVKVSEVGRDLWARMMTDQVLVLALPSETIRLGQLRGPCGVLKTSPRRLFPFKAATGEWLLQYDTRPRYTRGTSTSTFLWSSRKITIAG